MSVKSGTAMILTANELLSGAVVYFTADGTWVEQIGQARLFNPDQVSERDEALAKAMGETMLLSVELEVARLENGVIIAHRLRERIRASGPTAPRMARQTVERDNVPL